MTTGRPMLLLLLAALALLPASAAASTAASAAAPPAASGRSLQKEKGEAQPSAWFDEMDLFVPQFDEDGQGGDKDRDISRPQSPPTPRPPIPAAAAGPAECGLQWSRSVGCGAKATRDGSPIRASRKPVVPYQINTVAVSGVTSRPILAMLQPPSSSSAAEAAAAFAFAKIFPPVAPIKSSGVEYPSA